MNKEPEPFKTIGSARMTCPCGNELPHHVGYYECRCGAKYTIVRSPRTGANLTQHQSKRQQRLRKRTHSAA